MSSADRNQRILKEPVSFRGTVSFESHTYDVEFDIFTDETHNIWARFKKSDESLKRFFAMGSYGSPGESISTLSISGIAPEGRSFLSEHFYPKFDEEKDAYGVFYRSQYNDPNLRNTEYRIFERYFRGFEAFDSVEVDTSLGKVRVGAAAGITNRQQLSGAVTVISDAETDKDSWLNDTRKFMEHMHAGLSFIDGGWLRTPLERYWGPDGGAWIFYNAFSSPRELPPEHFLNNREIIESLIRNYFSASPVDEKVWNALGWMQLDTTNHSGRLLAAMTAIELWLSSQFSEDELKFVSDDDFEPLRVALKQVIDCSDIDNDFKQSAREKLKYFHEYSLRRKVRSAFELKGISLNEISRDLIQKLVETRNAIVHRGEQFDDDREWAMVLLAREILTRVVLHSLGFEGSYDSYLGGAQHRRSFPNCEKQK